MGDYEESEIDYISGEITGIVRTAYLLTVTDVIFDEEKWRDLAGSDVTYSTFPSYPSKDARRKQEHPLTLMNWDDVPEVATLAPGEDIPTDRTGFMVFADGTVVDNRAGENRMYTVPKSIHELISRFRDLRI